MRSAQEQEAPAPLFPSLSAAADAADAEQDTATEIESLCMNCHQDGVTRLLLTRIPHYREVVLMSFSCEACGYCNNEIQPGGPIGERGVRWRLRVETPEDLNRQLVKSDYCSVRIEELDFEIPAQSQKGEITTVEGVIARAVAGLSQEQDARRERHPADAALIDGVLGRLRELTDVRRAPFTLVLEDISGNSFVENPKAPQRDPRCRRVDFARTPEQDHLLGIYSQSEVSGEEADTGAAAADGAQAAATRDGVLVASEPGAHSYERLLQDEVLTFRTNCPSCGAPADTNMKITNIPHFKEVVIMATTCDACGHRTNEVKSGGGIEDRGVRIEVRVAGRDDFSRDILKSDTCTLSIPELDLEVGGAALGGRFTTAEGLLRATLEQLRDAPGLGDSAAPRALRRMDRFLESLEGVLAGESAVTLILDDPAGNSYVQSLEDDRPDDGLKISRYERTHEQNEDLGINDMRTENYEQAT